MPQFQEASDRFRGRPIPSSRCTIQISLHMEERLITVMEIIKLGSVFEVHRSRFRTAFCIDRVW